MYTEEHIGDCTVPKSEDEFAWQDCFIGSTGRGVGQREQQFLSCDKCTTSFHVKISTMLLGPMNRIINDPAFCLFCEWLLRQLIEVYIYNKHDALNLPTDA